MSKGKQPRSKVKIIKEKAKCKREWEEEDIIVVGLETANCERKRKSSKKERENCIQIKVAKKEIKT